MPDFSEARKGVSKTELSTAIKVLTELKAKCPREHFPDDNYIYATCLSLLKGRMQVFY